MYLLFRYHHILPSVWEEMGFGDRTHPKKLRVEYRKQAFKGDMIYPVINDRTEGGDDGGRVFTVSLNGEDGKPYCLVELKP